jgi:hypothetical protein
LFLAFRKDAVFQSPRVAATALVFRFPRGDSPADGMTPTVDWVEVSTEFRRNGLGTELVDGRAVHWVDDGRGRDQAGVPGGDRIHPPLPEGRARRPRHAPPSRYEVGGWNLAVDGAVRAERAGLRQSGRGLRLLASRPELPGSGPQVLTGRWPHAGRDRADGKR